jgi:Ca2+-transporting ATPase
VTAGSRTRFETPRPDAMSNALTPAKPTPPGLSHSAAADRLREDGPNALPRPESRGIWRICLEVLREPMFALLLAGGVIYLVIGEARDAAVLLAFANLSVGIAVVQELRSERVLEALRDLSSPTALVIREGQRSRIPASELVRGDLIVVSEGDRVPADAVLVDANEVQTDESLITGESAPVAKVAADGETPLTRPADEASASIYAGSLVVRGQGLALVAATGPATEVGRIGRALATITSEPTDLTREMRAIVRLVGLAALVVCASVVLILGLGHAAWLKGLLAGVSLGMAMIPEEFPLVLTVFMVMGAWRISRAGVLTRKASAIETLGSASVLCTDKTGTLTLNRMTIAGGWRDGRFFTPEDDAAQGLAHLVRLGVLASAADPFDPMERAFHAGGAAPAAAERLTAQRLYGLRPDLLAVTQVWSKDDAEAAWLVAAKGAPEAIADLCDLPPDQRAAVLSAAEALAERGMRVLGVAEGRLEEPNLPETPHEFDLTFAGLVGLADPLRPDVPEAVRACRAAGVRVVMVTGDYPTTARSIADQAGLAPGAIITGPELAALSDEDLIARAPSVTIFARILPEQKLRIVRALRAAGDVVAMTGDGVNDAPALKAADIGVAMGERGSDVAREAAALVLLRDGFAPIVETIRLGRRIYDNLRDATSFILAVHIPLIGLALFPLLAGGDVLLGPVHIAFLEMIIDPVCSVVFEAEAETEGLMRRPPRPRKDRLFTPARLFESLSQGAIGLAAVVGVYAFSQWRGVPVDQARASAFTALVLANIALIFANRSLGDPILRALTRPNAWLWGLLTATLALLACMIFIGPVRQLFEFGPLDTIGLAAALGAGLAAFASLMLLRAGLRRHEGSKEGRRLAALAGPPDATSSPASSSGSDD